jgi:hypothetical protein
MRFLQGCPVFGSGLGKPRKMSSTPTGLHQPAAIQQRPLPLQGLFYNDNNRRPFRWI